MLDFVERCFGDYHSATGWNACHGYAHFNCASNAILAFQPPAHSAHFVLAKAVTPQLMAIYALGLPQVRSLAYLFSSVSIAADRTAATPVARLRHTFLGHHYGGRRISGSRASNDAPSTTVDEVSVSQEPDANTRAPLSGDHVADLIAPDRTRAISAALSRPYLLFGRMAGDGRLQAIWTRRHGPRVQTVLSGISSLSNDHPSQFNGLLQYQSVRAQRGHGGWAHDLSFSASRVHALVGAKTVYAIARSPWAVGGELYYTHTETSGGLSFGCRYRTRVERSEDSAVDLCLVVNPIMGHVSASHTTSALDEDLLLSARYDFNIYSYASDLSFGIIYAPAVKQQAIKFRVGMEQGLSLVWEAMLGPATTLSVGVLTALGTPDPYRRVGVELQYDASG